MHQRSLYCGALALLSLAAGCHRHTLVDIRCIPASARHLEVAVTLDGVTNGGPLPSFDSQESFPPSRTFLIVFPDGSGGMATATVTALDQARNEIGKAAASFSATQRSAAVSFDFCDGGGGGSDLAGLDLSGDDLASPDAADLASPEDASSPDQEPPLKVDLVASPPDATCVVPPSIFDLGPPSADGWVKEPVVPGGNAVWAASEMSVYTVFYNNGGYVYRRNGSGTWSASTPMVSTSNLFGIWGTSDNNVYAVGATGVFHSSNNIISFGNQAPLANVKGYFHAVWGSSANDVYAVGADTIAVKALIYRGTSASAVDWKVSRLEPMASTFSGVWGSGPNDVYAVATNGLIVRSTNQGTSWTTNTQLFFEMNPIGLNSVWGSGPCDVYVVGSRGSIYHSTGNDTWTPQPSNTASNIHSVWGTGANDVWFVADNNLVGHSTGDGTWTTTVVPVGNSGFRGINGAGHDVYAVDPLSVMRLRH